MLRTVLCCAALAFLVLSCRADEPAANPETLIRLTVHPAAAPRPALRYLLLPELKEMNPGNPVQNYLKCFAEQHRFFFDKEVVQRREKLLVMPLKELPARELLDYGGLALRQADWAARLDNPDWQILLNLKAQGIYVMVPEVQELRSLSQALKVVPPRSPWAGSTTRGPPRPSWPWHATWASTRPLWQSRGLCDRNRGRRPPGGDAGAARLSQPLLGADAAARPTGPRGSRRQGDRIGMFQWMFRDLDDNAPMSTDRFEKFLPFMDKLLRTEFPHKLPEGLRAWLDARAKDEGLVRAAASVSSNMASRRCRSGCSLSTR